MGKPTGFLETDRIERGYLPVDERVRNYKEFYVPLGNEEMRAQGARCMDCGIPYCHEGCPVNNIIPEWNDLVYRDQWRDALDVLHSTNNFPEFTGRVCPAPCESACTLNLIEKPVTIKTIECEIVDRGWREGWILPQIPKERSGKRVAVVGSGPAGMAASQQLARAGHSVVLFEKHDRIGGLIRYGIPDFKLDKVLVDKRMQQMSAEGVIFRPNVNVGVDIEFDELLKDFDAIVMSGGSEAPRDLPATGRDTDGVQFAMDFLRQNNKRVAGDDIPPEEALLATDKHVIVIGGGDTGSDCVGTSNRHGARSITQIEILDKPPLHEDKLMTWPDFPAPTEKLRTSSSHEEGTERDWSITTKEFVQENGKLKSIRLARVEWMPGEDGRPGMREIEGSEYELPADLVLLAMGFLHPIHEGMIEQSGVELDPRGNVLADEEDYNTSIDKVFAAGDMRRGQSWVVWAIREGRQCARSVDAFLMGSSNLPR